MCPVLFHIGSFPVRSFGILLVLGFLAGIYWAKLRAPRFGIEPAKVWDAAFWMMVCGVVGARLAFILQELPHYMKNPQELWTIQFNGLTSFGGIILGFVALVVWAKGQKVPLLKALDLFALPMLLTHAIGRVGCLLNGCCYGGPINGFPGVHFVGLEGLHQPAQLYDAAMVVVGALLLTLLERREMPRGRSAGLAIAVYGVSRFIYEFWRAGTVEQVRLGIASSTYWDNLPITQAQAMAVVTVLAGLLLALLGRKECPVKDEVPAT